MIISSDPAFMMYPLYLGSQHPDWPSFQVYFHLETDRKIMMYVKSGYGYFNCMLTKGCCSAS